MFQHDDSWREVLDEMIGEEVLSRNLFVTGKSLRPVQAGRLRNVLLARVDSRLQAEVGSLLESLMFGALDRLSDEEIRLILDDPELDGVDPSLLVETSELSLEESRKRYSEPDS